MTWERRGGGGVHLPPHSRGWPRIVLSRGHLPRSRRPPGPWPLHPDRPLLLVCRGLRGAPDAHTGHAEPGPRWPVLLASSHRPPVPSRVGAGHHRGALGLPELQHVLMCLHTRLDVKNMGKDGWVSCSGPRSPAHPLWCCGQPPPCPGLTLGAAGSLPSTQGSHRALWAASLLPRALANVAGDGATPECCEVPALPGRGQT